MSSDNLISLLQICDSGFPTGAYSHSSGLEAALKVNVIHNTESLTQFLLCCLENAGSFGLPFVMEAHQQYTDITALCELDRLCDACTPNHVAKRASTRQGRSMMDTSRRVFNLPSLEKFSGSLPCKHLTVVYGVLCATLDISVQASSIAFLFCTVRTALASAVRLDKVGPIEAQRIQTELQQEIPKVVERHKQRESVDACMIYPHIDIVQNVHDTMFTKLFYS